MRRHHHSYKDKREAKDGVLEHDKFVDIGKELAHGIPFLLQLYKNRYNAPMKEIAIIGPTASGKSALAIELAAKHDAYILSLDSLAIYKEIDIVSAKPSKEELARVRHFGVDELYPDEYFSVAIYLDIYAKAKEEARKKGKHLIIVGGTSFYLKTLLEGLSPMPQVDERVQRQVARLLQDIEEAYRMLQTIDPVFAARITAKDRYRIQKGFEILYATGMKPSDYFAKHPPKAITDLPIYEIAIDRETLRRRIAARTHAMVEMGLIDETVYLEKRYGRAINPMKAIGIKETLQYLDGKIPTIEALEEAITTHTAQLAKRQQTFNKTQLEKRLSAPLEKLREELDRELAD